MSAKKNADNKHKDKTKQKMNNIRVCYNGIGVENFMMNVIRSGKDYPSIRDGNGNVINGYLNFVVIGFWRGTNQQNDNFENVSTFFEACLMDASKSVFCARLAEPMTGYVEKNPEIFKIGSIIRVSDYTLLWMQTSNKWNWRVVMIVNKFHLHCGPQNMEEDYEEINGNQLPNHIHRVIIHKSVVSKVLKDTSLLFLARGVQRGQDIWSSMPMAQVKKGLFITEGVQRSEWLTKVRRMHSHVNKPRELRCCCLDNLGYKECVLVTFPLEHVDYSAVLPKCEVATKNEGHEQLGEKLVFKNLSARDKRACVRKYYSKTYFCLKIGKYSVPKCFTEAVRRMYPDPKKEFFWRHYCTMADEQTSMM